MTTYRTNFQKSVPLDYLVLIVICTLLIFLLSALLIIPVKETPLNRVGLPWASWLGPTQPPGADGVWASPSCRCWSGRRCALPVSVWLCARLWSADWAAWRLWQRCNDFKYPIPEKLPGSYGPGSFRPAPAAEDRVPENEPVNGQI